MVDIVSALSLQARSRRNARKALRIVQRQRAERLEAAKALAFADAHGDAWPAGAGQQRAT